MNNKEQTDTSKNKPFAANFLLSLLEQNPQIIKPEIGAEAFVKDLLKANEIYHRPSPSTIGAVKHLIPFFKICPHIFKPNIGLGHLMEELIKTAELFFPYMSEAELRSHKTWDETRLE